MGLLLGRDNVCEGCRGPREAGRQGDDGAAIRGGRFVFERLLQDPLDAADIHEVERQRPGTRGVHARRPEALGERSTACACRKRAQGKTPSSKTVRNCPTAGPRAVPCAMQRSGARRA